LTGSRIRAVKARQVLDSNGRPVVEVDVLTESGHLGRAGASTGSSVEANGPSYYGTETLRCSADSACTRLSITWRR